MMYRQQPSPMPWLASLRIASTVVALLAALAGPTGPASAATNPVPAGDAQAPEADSTSAAFRRLEAAVRACGAGVSADARAGAEVVLGASAKRVDDAAMKTAPLIAARLALEFGTTLRALTDERARLGATWSEIAIAHTLAASLQSTVAAAQLVELHQGGVGWGLLAAGLGLDLSDVVNAVRAECRVATGWLPADGHVVQIRGDGPRPSAAGNTGITAILAFVAGASRSPGHITAA